MSKAEWSKGDIELGINFIDSKGKDLYGGFDLRFYDFKYNIGKHTYAASNI